jgi:nucleoside phosphorylase
VDVLVHAGGAAALADELEIGTLVGAAFVLEGDRVALDTPTYPRMPLDLPFDLPTEGTLVSQDHTDDEDAEERSYWERLADLRDETGYAVAYVAAQHGVPCHIVKGITHRAGAETDSTDQQKVYEAVATFLQDHLGTLTDESDS